MNELQFVPLSRNSTHGDTEIAIEQAAPSPKRVCSSPQDPPCNANHNVDFDVMGDDSDCSSFSDFEDNNLNDRSLRQGLGKWANKFQVKQNTIDGLLELVDENGHTHLPTSARTLLLTARSIHVQTKSGMEYIYFSLVSE